MPFTVVGSAGFEEPTEGFVRAFVEKLPPDVSKILEAGNFTPVPNSVRRLSPGPRTATLSLEADHPGPVVLLQRSGDFYKFALPVAPDSLLESDRVYRFDVRHVSEKEEGTVQAYYPTKRLFQTRAAPQAQLMLYSTRDKGWKDVSDVRDIKCATKLVVMIHGFISSVEVGFASVDYSGLPAGRTLFGYNHDTVFTSPQDNAEHLLTMLCAALESGYAPDEIDVICHSRGGLVSRAFFGLLAARKPNWPLGRFSSYGSPHQGTTLAETIINLANTLLNAALHWAVPFLPGKFAQLLLGIAENALIPGATALLPGHQTRDTFSAKAVGCIRAEHVLDSWGKELALFLAYDAPLFHGHRNDMIVDTRYMSLTYETEADLVENHTHFEYFESGHRGHTPFVWPAPKIRTPRTVI